MSTDPTEAEAAVLSAIDTLMGQLEAEHAWNHDLKQALEASETRSARLMTSVEAAIHTLPIRLKRGAHIRLARMRQEGAVRGRPAKDGRQAAMMHFIADRAEGRVTTAELRLHLKQRGLKATPQYVSNQMAAWITEGLLTREGHGVYRINEASAALRTVRFRRDREALMREVRAELHNVREGLEKKPEPLPISDWVE